MLSATTRPSRKTDVYAMGFVCLEILCSDHKLPMEDLGIGDDRNKLIDEVVRMGSRPKLADLHPDMPPSYSIVKKRIGELIFFSFRTEF